MSRRQEMPNTGTAARSRHRREQATERSQRPKITGQQTKFNPLRFLSSAEITLVRKDLGSIWARRGLRAVLIFLPLILMVGVPSVCFVAVSLLPVPENGTVPELLLSVLPGTAGGAAYRPAWFYVFTTLICPLLYLCVPVSCAVASASCAFVAERENQTLDALFLSGMEERSIFQAKTATCTLLSCLVSVLAFVSFATAVTVFDVVLDAPYFFSWEWLVLLLVLTPILSFFSVVFVSFLINRVYSALETLQLIGYLVLPLTVLYLIQFTGVLKISFLFLLLLAVALASAGLLLFRAAQRRFYAENLLARPIMEDVT